MFKKSLLLQSVLLLIFLLALFSYFSFKSDGLWGVDSWYHIKITEMYTEYGFFREFPWMQFSPMKYHYADRWFLFHIGLIPFVFGDLVIGAKLAVVFYSSLIFLIFFLILNKLNISKAPFWTFVFLSSRVFITRLFLLRAFIFSIIFFFVFIYMLNRRNYKGLFLISLVYASTYSLFPILLLFSMVFVITDYIHNRNIDKKIITYCSVGIIVGLVLNPYFPFNIFYNAHEINTMFFWMTNKQAAGTVGTMFPNEVRLTPINEGFIETAYFISVFLGIGALYYLFSKEKNPTKSTVLIITLFFTLFYVNSPRFLEYWVPFGAFSCGLFFDPLIKKFEKEGFEIKFNKFKINEVSIFFLFLLVFLGGMTLQNWSEMDLGADNNAIKLNDCALWLKDNTPPRTVVFAFWDEFPFLFHYNTENYYILGINPLDLYIHNSTLFYTYAGIFSPREVRDVESIIENFKPDYLLFSGHFFWIVPSEGINNRTEPLYDNGYCSVWEV